MRRTLAVTGVLVALAFVLVSTGCQNDAQTGALAGGLIGAAAGQAIGGNTEGTLIGGAVGAGGGYIIGNESDKSKAAQEAQYSREQANTYVVNIRNSNGSITPVTLRRMGNMWVGPNGEQYENIPSQQQLQGMYGR
jgi:hypothetical protein